MEIEINWRQYSPRLHKREDVLNDLDIANATPDDQEKYWQDYLKNFAAEKERFEKYPRFAAEIEGISLRVHCLDYPEGVWHYWVYYRTKPPGKLLDAHGSLSGNVSTEAEAKGEAVKAYFKIKEVKDSVETLRDKFYAKWGGPEKK